MEEVLTDYMTRMAFVRTVASVIKVAIALLILWKVWT